MNPKTLEIKSVLDFWFGEIAEDGFCNSNRYPLWFKGDEALDCQIREQFGALVELAASGALDDWRDTPEGRVALIILLDQFTRNIYRGQAKAYSLDEKAKRVCKEGLALAEDKKLPFAMRLFLYLPLEHSENRADQDISLKLHHALFDEIPEKSKPKFQRSLEYAEIHRNIIVQFGRYPHRNQVLGRKNTAEEAIYLSGNYSRFGQ
jgi:uncharacterized protein (DUF924 family)